jgi:hypothetical protein
MHRTLALSALLVPLVSVAQTPAGPDAPTMAITYDGTSLQFTLSNPQGSNNENGMYAEEFTPVDPTPDPFWRFQGYVIYELAQADADDSLTLVVQDLLRAQAIGWTDVTDGVLSAWNNFILDGDSCVSGNWDFDNNGPITVMESVVSAITGEAWHPDSTYCFAAMAFATTPHYVDPDCGTEQNMLFSRQSPFGALQAQCITPATVGVPELVNAPMRIWPSPVTDVLHVRAPAAGSWQATCLDAQGRIVRQQRINDEDVIPVQDLSVGIYQIVLRADDGRVMSERFVVDRTH